MGTCMGKNEGNSDKEFVERTNVQPSAPPIITEENVRNIYDPSRYYPDQHPFPPPSYEEVAKNIVYPPNIYSMEPRTVLYGQKYFLGQQTMMPIVVPQNVHRTIMDERNYVTENGTNNLQKRRSRRRRPRYYESDSSSSDSSSSDSFSFDKKGTTKVVSKKTTYVKGDIYRIGDGCKRITINM